MQATGTWSQTRHEVEGLHTKKNEHINADEYRQSDEGGHNRNVNKKTPWQEYHTQMQGIKVNKPSGHAVGRNKKTHENQ